jgi:hypothetical protein
METLPQMAATLQQLLSEVADQVGRASGFIQRQRKLSGASFVQTLVFGWMAKGNSTMEELSQSAANIGVQVSRQGLDDRFNEAAAGFLRQMVEESVKCVLRGNGVTNAVLARFNGVYVEDSTVIELPERLQSVWAGCNRSALKVSVRWDLHQGGLEQVQLQPGREHDQQALLHHLPTPVGALHLRDLGYFDLETLATQADNGCYWIMRYKVGTVVFTPDDSQVLDLLQRLTEAQAQPVDWPVLLGAKVRLPCRLVAQAVSPDILKQRQQELKRWQHKHQQQASPTKKALLGWDIYLTNAPFDLLATAEVFEVAHLRWQLELLFKLWKSEGFLDSWRTDNPWRILCEVYAKLIAVIIQHWLILMGDGHDLSKSLVQMSRTLHKKAWHLASVLSQTQALLNALTDIQRCFSWGCRISRSASSPPAFQRLALT